MLRPLSSGYRLDMPAATDVRSVVDDLALFAVIPIPVPGIPTTGICR